jgi:2-polyprenyl-3-methyl-5-hydroxy-6-metoxy-1,4-benzoquinol methylase
MSARDRQRWDVIYRETMQEKAPPVDAILYQYTPPPSGEGESRALDLAGGLGQNGLWLAQQGYTVDVMDISRVALMRAQGAMAELGLRNMNFFQVDFDEANLPAEHYDLVCVFRYLHRDLFPQLRATVRPGGRIIYETYNVRYLDTLPDFNRSFLLEPGELPGYFADWKIVYNYEQRHLSQLVALKPER